MKYLCNLILPTTIRFQLGRHKVLHQTYHIQVSHHSQGSSFQVMVNFVPRLRDSPCFLNIDSKFFKVFWMYLIVLIVKATTPFGNSILDRFLPMYIFGRPTDFSSKGKYSPSLLSACRGCLLTTRQSSTYDRIYSWLVP